jgi:ribonuclease HII
MPDFSHEDASAGVIAGVDEAGRGPWAGPVVAAAVVLDRARLPADLAVMIDDSKKLKRDVREAIFGALPEYARIGVGVACVAEIDTINILQAALLAMQRAIAALAVTPDLALIDGNKAPALPCAACTLIGGDALSLSIAAASIVAKVTRDRLMLALAAEHPGYGWEHNVGYGTPEHRLALQRLGATRQHRRSFAPVREVLSPPGEFATLTAPVAAVAPAAVAS